ncbi:hypothetical protein Cni_G26183 [Canna indica]|uniref:Rab-GAP TBC domain-containing protein n=1 Tax=Canna indica TaxID=4628 RepID=A0AAQ3QLR6_9LILI|nr:hypothetical protein Cni_G26183 [Canna indica]
MPPGPALDQTSSPERELSTESRFSNLRGVRWRIYLGILPRSPASIDDLRRVAADARRRYANLRRRLIVDPHLSKDESKSSDLVMDNPLSQSPDSIWSRYFQNAELEKMLDQDLSRLYPEQGSYFQTTTCQTMLRRILLLWCLIHPECGYRQGMHEVLAPLLYVLYIDLQYLSQVRGQYEDHFNDEFQGVSLSETDLISTLRFEKILNKDVATDRNSSSQEKNVKVRSSNELDPETRDIFLMSDAYGAEGELGIVLSEKFMEHDAYCMFDTLMNDARGVVSMAEFFSPSPTIGSSTGLTPIIEASSAIYQLLAVVDSSLHSHLVELGVEPQYFAMRWLRVLFGREFSLQDLLIVWDEIFSFPNHTCFPDKANEAEFRCRILCSPRGAFILSMAVSMLLHLRSSLLATDYSTACLQRLLNFPEDISAEKLIEKAKALHNLALDMVFSCSSQAETPQISHAGRRRHSLSYGSSPLTPNQLPDSYWEEKWRLLHASEELKKVNSANRVSSEKAKGPLIDRFNLSRTESDPYPIEIQENKIGCQSDRLTIENHNGGKDNSKYRCGVPIISATEESFYSEVEKEVYFHGERTDQNVMRKHPDIVGETDFSAENLSIATSPVGTINDHEYDSEESSVTSTLFVVDTHDEINHVEKPCNNSTDKEEITKSESEIVQGSYRREKKPAALKQWKSLAGKLQWLRKTNRSSGEGKHENGQIVEQKKSCVDVDPRKHVFNALASDPCCTSLGVHGKIDNEDKDATGALKSIAKSMLENIRVIQVALKHDQVHDGSGVDSKSNTSEGRETQAAAVAALEELRKISNLLLEM